MSTRQRLVMSALLGLAAVLLVLGFQWSKDREDTPVVRDTLVVAVYPEPGDQMLRQDTIFAEVQVLYTGELRVDGIQITEPHLQRIQTGAATRISYTPGDGTPTGVLSAGTHRATLVYWPPEQGRSAAREYIWSFTVT